MTQYNPVIARLMNGAIDTHVHNGPEGELERRQDVLEAAQRAQGQGMRAIVLKNKEYSTAPLAYLVNKLVPGFTAVGAIVCDLYVGGLNPLAVDMALRQGARVVWMPTHTSHAQLQRGGLLPGAGDGRPRRSTVIGEDSLRRVGEGIRLLDDAGKLLPVVHEILDLAAEHGAVIQSGHIGTDELLTLITATRERRLDVICTHANFFYGANEQKQLAAPDVFIELCNITALSGRQTYEQLAEMLRVVGASHCVLGTDLGQFNNPYPVEGYRSFIAGLLLNGVSEEDLVMAAQRNAARVLRLDAGDG
jgi:hypothetical protein